MGKPNFRVVDNENLHARDLAHKAVKRWRSNAEKENRPVTNITDSGAPSLRVDDVLLKAQSDHLGKK